MIRDVAIRRNRYMDSVLLMRAARAIAGEPGIRDAAALMATEANRKLLAELGYEAARLAEAGPNDVIVAVEGEDRESVARVLADLDSRLDTARPAAAGVPVRTLDEAVARRPDAGVAVISVPGEYAAREARAALERGLHVFLFSSNVSVEDEVRLKTDARTRGLLVMGPDCGTALLCGAGIGFSNAVRRGPVGAVGSSGTGLQELTCLVHRAGSGISHAIGTGSRDLSDAVGGISTFQALDALEDDPGTGVIVLLSKPPGTATLPAVMARLSRCRKPAVACLLGADWTAVPAGDPTRATFRHAATIDAAARMAVETVTGTRRPDMEADPAATAALAAREVSRMVPSRRFVRGVFAGGTFCSQTRILFREAGLLPGHLMTDMGAEEFVQGRPHPMIDSTLRAERALREAEDPQTAVLLLDFILGAVSSPGPVEDMMDAIVRAKRAASDRGGPLCVAASVTGTEGDMQGLAKERRLLEEAGVIVFESNARAALFCREAARLLDGRRR